MALGASWAQRQHQIQPINRLKSAFLVHTKYRRVLQWMKVEADHIGGFGLEIWIVAGHVAVQPVWLDAGFLPNAVTQIFGNAEKVREFAATAASPR